MDDMTVKDLKEVLSQHKDSDKVTINLAFKPRSDGYTKKLEQMLHKAYSLILDAQTPVKYCKDVEKKTKSLTMYYDRRAGYNTGAAGLLADMKEFTQTFSQCILRASIEN